MADVEHDARGGGEGSGFRPWDACTGDPCTCPKRPTTRDVLREVHAERNAQDRKWGEQNHPDGTGPEVWWTRHLGPAHVVRDTYRDLTDAHASGVDGPVTWLDILREEIGEAFAEEDPAALRAELVQVAAVAVSWVQAIDRRNPPC